MESSPLTQQFQGTLEPKIGELYLHLFNALANDGAEDAVPSEGFWRELFLLPPDKSRLHQILDPLTADDVLQIQTQTRAFFRRAIIEAGSGVTPRNENALENLTGFLAAVLSKRYTNPSTDIIEVLAGLDLIDKLVSDLVNGLEIIIRQGTSPRFRTKAIETALSLVSGSYQTTLVSYFIHRDMFPALMKYVHDTDEHSFEAFILLGLLANYNKFETQNPYQNRLEDFVNEDTIHRLARNVGSESKQIRERYVQVQEDVSEGWTLDATLTYVGLRALSPRPKSRHPPLTEEEIKTRFNALPPIEATISLSTYSFVNANKLFAASLATLPPDSKSTESPFSLFLSATSYAAHHAYRSRRASQYTVLNLLTIRLLMEDSVLVKRLSASEPKISVRLARQRPPSLPLISAPRIPIAVILDICTDTMSHNLRRRIDIPLYSLLLGIIFRITTNLDGSKIRLQHHWSYIWGSLLSLLRFLVQYAPDLTHMRNVREDLCTPLTSLIAHCLSKGDAFLPDPASYDDLFYKLIEASDVLHKFKNIYCSSTSTSASATLNPRSGSDTRKTSGDSPSNPPTDLNRSINALLSVSQHYNNLLATTHGKKTHQSPAAIQKVITDGYETLSLNLGDDGFGGWEKWREGAWKADLKKIIRMVVEDAREVAMR